MRVQWVKCFLHKQENLSSDPNTYVKAKYTKARYHGAPVTRAGSKGRQILRAHWPANLDKMVNSRFGERLSTQKPKVEKELRETRNASLWPVYVFP